MEVKYFGYIEFRLHYKRLHLITKIILELIPYEDVIKQLHEDIVSSNEALGIGGGRLSCGSFAQAAVITLKVWNLAANYKVL